MTDPAIPSTRALIDQWLRALTIVSDPCDTTLPNRLEQVGMAHHPDLAVPLAALLSAEGQRARRDALAAISRLRAREFGVHALVADLLMRWLAQATGATRGEIITRLAVTIDRMLPDDDPTPGSRDDAPPIKPTDRYPSPRPQPGATGTSGTFGHLQGPPDSGQ